MTSFGSKAVGASLAWLISAGMLVPTFAFAEQAPTANPVQDVSLNENHELIGRLVDRTGGPLADVEMALITKRREVTTSTDADGNFIFANLKGSVCVIESGRMQQHCRVWMANTAPPAASKGLLLVADDELVARGQNQRRRRRRLLLTGGRIGMRAAMIPFMAAGALARKRDNDAEEEEAAGENSGVDANAETSDTSAEPSADPVAGDPVAGDPSADADASQNAGAETNAETRADVTPPTDASVGPDPEPSIATDTLPDAAPNDNVEDADFIDSDFSNDDFDDDDFDIDVGDSNTAS